MSRGDIPPRSRPTDVTGFIPPTAEAVCATCRVEYRFDADSEHPVHTGPFNSGLVVWVGGGKQVKCHPFKLREEADAVAAAREKMAAALVEYGQALSAAGLDEDIDRAVASQIENPRARVAELEAALREIIDETTDPATPQSELGGEVADIARRALAPSAEEGGE